MSAALFEIDDLHANAAGTDQADILTGVNLTVNTGEVHALLGPKGSGKSTLAATLLGSPQYAVTGGAIRLKGDDITAWGPDVRGKAGMFLAFQDAHEIPGVSVLDFLRQAHSSSKGTDLSMAEFRESIVLWMHRLGIDPTFADRFLNEELSAGEKKQNEILQMAILEPEFAILDETDAGLDSDSVEALASGIQQVRQDRPELGLVVITHQHQLLGLLQPNHVHILCEGKIIDSGGIELAAQLENEGFDA